jgi:hypothetical protein
VPALEWISADLTSSTQSREISNQGGAMQLTFLGGDSGPSGSPRVYATDRGTFVVQGWRVEDAETLAQLRLPGHETCVEIPSGLLKYLPRD